MPWKEPSDLLRAQNLLAWPQPEGFKSGTVELQATGLRATSSYITGAVRSWSLRLSMVAMIGHAGAVEAFSACAMIRSIAEMFAVHLHALSDHA